AAVPSGTYSATRRSFGEWTFESGRPKPVITTGIPLSPSAGTIGRVPPDRTRAGRTPSTFSNASRPSWIAFEPGGTRPGGAVDLRPRRRRFAQEALDDRRDLVDVLARRQANRDVRDRLDGKHRLLQHGRAGCDPVHVERRLGERPQIEVLGCALVLRPCALV